MSASRPLFAIVIAASACIRELPPAEPARIVPELARAPGPVPPGTGRVIVDVTAGPADVALFLKPAAGSAPGRRPQRVVCKTPCVLDLPRGKHRLAIVADGSDRGEVLTIEAGARPRVYRGALGHRRSRPDVYYPSLAGALLGLVGVGTGAAIGLDSGTDDPHYIPETSSLAAATYGRSDDLSNAGIAVAFTGAALAAVSAFVLWEHRDEHQPDGWVSWEPDGEAWSTRAEAPAPAAAAPADAGAPDAGPTNP